MTREQYIKAVKVKLDEVSAFDEDDNPKFVDTDDDDYKKVKPLYTYIDETLDKASEYCLSVLPLSLVSRDIEMDSYTAHIDTKGVGHVRDIDEYLRLVHLAVTDEGVWNRDVTAFITTSDPNYLLQQNKATRGGCAKPVVAYSPETCELELYSFPKSMWPEDRNDMSHAHVDLYYIQQNKKIEQVRSAIDDYIVLRCAAYVAEILESTQTAEVFMTEFTNKLAGILK